VEAQEILIAPFAVAEFVRVALLRDYGMAFELMQDLNDGRFGA
jgi:hypothetical protein